MDVVEGVPDPGHRRVHLQGGDQPRRREDQEVREGGGAPASRRGYFRSSASVCAAASSSAAFGAVSPESERWIAVIMNGRKLGYWGTWGASRATGTDCAIWSNYGITWL